MSHNWENYGIRWLTEPVSKQSGPNASSRVELGDAQIAHVEDVSKFVEHFGEAAALSFLNGTSLRVTCQRIGRAALQAGEKSPEAMQERVYNAIKGIRASRTMTRVVLRQLPDGTTTDAPVEEFRAEYVAQLVDQGVPAAIATSIAANLQ